MYCVNIILHCLCLWLNTDRQFTVAVHTLLGLATLVAFVSHSQSNQPSKYFKYGHCELCVCAKLYVQATEKDVMLHRLCPWWQTLEKPLLFQGILWGNVLQMYMNHRHLSNTDCLRFVICPLLAPS